MSKKKNYKHSFFILFIFILWCKGICVLAENNKDTISNNKKIIKIKSSRKICSVKKQEAGNSGKPRLKKKTKNRPKVVILCSRGGYTHISLSKVITELIGHKYNIEIVYIIDKLFPRISTSLEAYFMNLFKIDAGDSWYNNMLQEDRRKTLNMTALFFEKYISNKGKKISKIIDDFVEQPHTVMLISLIPFINSAAMLSAQKFRIPFLIVSVDSSLRIWLPNIKPPIYGRSSILLAYNLPSIHAKLDQLKWPDAHRHYAGLPIRDEFYKVMSGKNKFCTIDNQKKNYGSKNKDTLTKQAKEKLGIDHKKFTIMVMMGGSGSLASIDYVKELANKNFNGHVIVAAGRNSKLLQKLKAIKLPIGLTSTYLGFTNQISSYMAASDILLTKPGPTTFHEAIQLELPLLIESTKTLLEWEASTVDLVEKNGLGIILKKVADLVDILEKIKNNKKIINDMKSNARRYNKQLPGFRSTFCKTLEGLVQDGLVCN